LRRPVVIPGTEPSEAGTLVWPNLNGATVWFSPSYSPQEGLLYVATREIASIYFKRKAEYKPGTFFAGGGEARKTGLNPFATADAPSSVRGFNMG